MEGSIVGYSVRLEVWSRRDGRDWLAWCPAVDVMTQARAKKKAFDSLKEAVEGWFESCIDRGVLDKALGEVGFIEVGPDESPDAVNSVQVIRESAPIMPSRVSFSLGHEKRVDYIEGILPAYIAAQQLGEAARAAY